MEGRLMLLSVIGGGVNNSAPTQVIDPEKATVDYLVGSPAWRLNPPVPIMSDNISTNGTVMHDDKGSYTHPSVIDFHGLTEEGLFAGHRYWMANSEYSTYGGENNMILCSDDAFTWRQPVGATPGPLQPLGAMANYTDPELAYDAAAGELVLLWRQDQTPGNLLHRKTSDGISWSGTVVAYSGNRMAFISPAVVPDGAGGWVLFAFGNAGYRMTASSLSGPWTTPASVPTLAGWHGDVWRDPDTGVLYAIVAGNGDTIGCLRSNDGGLTWVTTTQKAIIRHLAWETRAMYRPTLQPHPDDQHFRVWYSVNGLPGPDNRTGYTMLPRSLWDA